MIAYEFDETTANGPSITGLGTYYASEFSENIAGIVTSGLLFNVDAGNTASYPGIGNTWTDLSASGNNATLVNGPTYSSADGGSFTFNGSNQYATLGTPSSLNITGSITINSWVKFSSLPSSGNWSTIYGKGYDDTNEQTFLRYTGDSFGIEFGTYALSGNITYSTTYVVGSSVLVNNWCNIIGIFDGFKFSIYLNNVLVSQTAYAGMLLSSSAPVSIGAASIGSGGYQRLLNGNISSVQVYNRALSAAEISQNYGALVGRYKPGIFPVMTANVFAPYDLVYDEIGGTLFGAGQGRYMRQNTDKSVIVYNEIDEVTDFRDIVRTGLVLDLDAGMNASYSGSGTTWTDLSVYGNNGTLTNGPTYSSANGGSIGFNGSNQYVSLTNSSNFSFGTNNFAINYWFYANSLSGTPTIVDTRTDGTGSGSGFSDVFTGGNKYNTFVNNATRYTTNASFVVSTWYNICVTRSGSTTSVYINGTLDGTYADTLNISSNGLLIGRNINTVGTSYFNGRVSNVSIYNFKALTAAEISQNYNALKHRFGL
jgi:hypothetical protein